MKIRHVKAVFRGVFPDSGFSYYQFNQPPKKSKAHIVVDLLKELSFIEFRQLGNVNKIEKSSDFRKLYGIWKDREVKLADLRQKARQRKTL